MLKADMKKMFDQVDDTKDSQFDAMDNMLAANNKRFDCIDATLRQLDDHLLANDSRFDKTLTDTNAMLKQLMSSFDNLARQRHRSRSLSSRSSSRSNHVHDHDLHRQPHPQPPPQQA
jgi:hypothetical protein